MTKLDNAVVKRRREMFTRLLDWADAELPVPTQDFEHSIDGWMLAVRPSRGCAVIQTVDTLVCNSSLRDAQHRWNHIKATWSGTPDDIAHD